MSYLSTLLIFSIVLGAVFCAEVPCCVSKKFHAKMKILTGYLTNGSSIPTITENRLMIDHDRDHRMEFVRGYVFKDDGMSQTITNYSVINDYRRERSYNFNATWCMVETILNEDMNEGCVPDGLMWSGRYMFGSGHESVHVNAWSGVSNGFHMTFATSVEDCTPISFSRFGEEEDGTKVTENTLYVDFVQYGLSGDNVFDIPSHCPQPAMPNPIGK